MQMFGLSCTMERSSKHLLALDQELAQSAAKRISADYNMVHVLPQPNGFYRVGIYATKTKAEALKVLSYAKAHGIPSGWISYE